MGDKTLTRHLFFTTFIPIMTVVAEFYANVDDR